LEFHHTDDEVNDVARRITAALERTGIRALNPPLDYRRIATVTGPLGLIGAVPALLIFQQPFGFNAILGLIGLSGILMRNTLILNRSDSMAAMTFLLSSMA
jgi:hypothetical protein